MARPTRLSGKRIVRTIDWVGAPISSNTVSRSEGKRMKIEEIDLIVVGAGMSGLVAAMAAKAEDLRVLIVEPSNVLGGQGTTGGVAGFCGDTFRVNHIFAELIDRLAAQDLINPYNPNDDRREYELEWCAYYLQEMVLERGIKVLLHSRVIDAVAEDGRITGITVSTAGGIHHYRPRFVIDASGVSVVAAAAGFPVISEGANKHLPMSLYFTLWDSGRKVKPFLPDGLSKWTNDDEIPMTTLHFHENGKVEIKMKVVGFDAADGFGRSQAEIFARRQMISLIYYLQTHGYRGKRLDTYVLASVSRGIGVREERRIVGEHVLTNEEAERGTVFDDAVAVNTYHLDFHWTDKLQRAGTGITRMVEPYHIPLRALIPKGAKNLLVPGRGASAEQLAMSSFRVMGVVQAMGFGVGMAARRCLIDGSDLGDLDVGALQADIENSGQSLDLSYYGDYQRKLLLIREHVFGDDRPFAQCHASTLVQLRNNRFLVAWFGGTREGNDDVGIWLAERYQCAWKAPRRIAKIEEVPHWNPVLFGAPTGMVHLYFKVGPNCREWCTWTMTSHDEGATWTQARELAPGDPLTPGPVKDKPIVLHDGTWLAPNSSETSDTWDVFTDRSSDDGRSWQHSESVALDHEEFGGKGAIQPTLWESEPNRVHMLVRTTAGRIWRSDSDNGGKSWVPLYQTDLPNNNSGIDLARLYDGTLALVYNPVEESWGPRTPLRISLSFDNGATWPHQLDIETEAGEYSYPAIIPTVRGMAICYTWRRERVAFWHGSIEQITMRDMELAMMTKCPIAYTPDGESIPDRSPVSTI